MRGAVNAIMAAQKISAGGGGTITQVQGALKVTNAFGTVHTYTPDSTLTAGNTFVLGFFLANSTLPMTVSPTTNTAVALTQCGTPFDNGAGSTLYLYRLTNAGSGVTSISWTITGSNAGDACGIELANVTNSSPVDAYNSGSNGFQTGPSNGVSVTTTVANDGVFAFFRCDGRTLDGSSQSGSGFSTIPTSGTSASWLSYVLDAGATGAKAPALYFTAGSGSDAVVAALKKA
jgi:hypothetical protein